MKSTMRTALMIALLAGLSWGATHSHAMDEKVGEGKSEQPKAENLEDSETIELARKNAIDGIQKNVQKSLENAGMNREEIDKILERMKDSLAKNLAAVSSKNPAGDVVSGTVVTLDKTGDGVSGSEDSEVIVLGEMEDLLNMVVKIHDSAPKTGSQYRIGVQVKENLSDPESPSVVVERVLKASPAEKAGVKEGDSITKLNEDMVSSAEELLKRVQEIGKEGADLKVEVKRGDEVVVLSLKPEEVQDVHQSIVKAFSRPEFKHGWIAGGPNVRHFDKTVTFGTESSNTEVLERLDKLEKQIAELKEMVRELAK